MQQQFTPAQSDFIHHTLDKNCHARVIAGPGSGKTTTLLGRVKYLLDSGIQPSRILVLAFNRNIKNQFERKLSSLFFQSESYSETPVVSTFHAWGISLTYELFKIRPDDSLILSHEPADTTSLSILFKGIFRGGDYGKRGVKVVQKERNELISAATVLDALPEIAEQVEWFNEHWASRHELIEHCVYIMTTYRNMIGMIGDMHDKRPPEVDTLEWDKLVSFVSLVDEYLVSRGVTLFEDQIYRAAMYLSRSVRARQYLEGKYDYILVDEFQDVSEVSQFLIVCACSKQCQLNAVGDPRQSIFEFAGSDPQYLVSGIDYSLGHIQTYYLSESFRFGKQIANYANRIGQSLMMSAASTGAYDDGYGYDDGYDDLDFFDEHRSALTADQANIVGLKVRDSAYIEHDGQKLAAITAQWLTTNKSVVYIVRTHDQKMDAEAFLVKAGLHFKHNASGRHKSLVDSLLFILDCWTMGGIVGERPRFWHYAEGPAVNPAVLRQDSDNPAEQFEAFVRSFLLVEKLKAISPTAILLAMNERIYEEVLRDCCAFLSRYGQELTKSQLARMMAEQFIETIASRYDKQLCEIQDSENYIHVEVAHRVKGLEFDKVVLFDFSEGVFPYARMHSEVDEAGAPSILNDEDYITQERRLAFVACTRAKEELIFYIPSGRTMSRFLAS